MGNHRRRRDHRSEPGGLRLDRPLPNLPPAQDRPAAPQGGTTGGYGYEPQPATPASPASPVAWPEPGAPNGSDGASWPSYGELYGTAPETTPAEGGGAGSRGNHRAAQEPDYPDYYR